VLTCIEEEMQKVRFSFSLSTFFLSSSC
jgi:hypothetical protein